MKTSLRKNIFLLFFFILFFLSSLFGDVESPRSFFPPLIEEVSISPETPSIGEPVEIRAIIFVPEGKSEEMIIEVNLYYSIDRGVRWNKIEMENSKGNEKLFVATIPPQNEEKEVIFYITCVDTAGNVSSELPPKVEYQPKNKLNWIPKNNTLALICEDEDESPSAVADELDIRKVYAGVDEKHLYLKIILDGNLPQNSIQPFYQINISNVDKEDNHDKIWGDSYLYCSPMASTFNMPICGIGSFDVRGVISKREFKKVDHYIDKNELYLKIKREDIRDNPKKRIKLILISGYQNNPSRLHSIEKIDITSFIYIYFRNHFYKVKKKE